MFQNIYHRKELKMYFFLLRLHFVILLPEEYSFARNFECTPTKIW